MNEEQMSKVIYELLCWACDEYSDTWEDQVEYFRKKFDVDLNEWYFNALGNGWITEDTARFYPSMTVH